MEKIRWGILATGNIAGSLAAALQDVADAELVAVGSRSQASADAFGDEWGVPNRHPSYEALAADPEVDVIYIATPHPYHYDNMKLCLNAGKHVLCEKPLTLNAQQSAECIALARAKNLFLMEAIWMRCMPALLEVKKWLEEERIGKVRLVQAGFCFLRPFDEQHRPYKRELGGGALLDLGIYPLTLTTMFLGFPQDVYGQAHIGSTEVDELNALTLVYEDGVIAQLTSSMGTSRPVEAMISGSEGYIQIHDFFLRPNRVTICVNGQDPETVTIPYLGNGYPHEVIEVHNCLRAGKTESGLLTQAETQRMMELMDRLRQQWGVVYPGE